MSRRDSTKENVIIRENVQNKIKELSSDDDKRFVTLPPSQTIDIAFKHIFYTVSTSSSFLKKEKKTILHDVSGLFKSGELTAIMGSSGAGKSSLLNVLSGYIKEGVRGEIYANGSLVDADRVLTKTKSAYIMQDDYINPLFTVKENMIHAADVKLGHSANKKAKILLIESILNSMSMCNAEDTLCSKLSGGQRKRLNVCLELIDNPPILFLDEPTSGLDSSNCRLLVSELKNLVAAGRTVICTIHQPSSVIFSMFDHLYLLSSGRNVFQGDTSNLLPFLNYVDLPCPVFHNPADFVMDVVTGEFGPYTEKLVDAATSKVWRNEKSQIKSIEGKKKLYQVNQTTKKLKPSEWIRYQYLVKKFCIQLHRDWRVTYFKAIIHALVGILVGSLFYKYGEDASKAFINTIFFFSCTLYISYTVLMPATLKFPSQLALLKREHFNNWYKFSTWFLAFLTVDIPIQLFLTSVYIFVVYLLTGQLLEANRCILFFASSYFDTIIMDMIGLLLGSAKNPVNGITVASAILILATLYGGFLVPLHNLGDFMRFVSYFSYIRYSFQVKVTSIYGLDRSKLVCPNEVLYCPVRYPKSVFKLLGLEDGQIVKDLSMLVVYTIITTSLAYFRLKHILKCFR